MKTYTAKTGLNYIPPGAAKEKRVEAGEDCSDVSAEDVQWLLECGHIEEADEETTAAPPEPERITSPLMEAPDGD